MKPILFFLAFLNVGTLFAQLSIAPSAKNDSYVYVKDRLLYVENDIELTKNKNPQTEASLYLRIEAQLLQNNTASKLNSGNGFLSVFQEGTSNAYDYNYWAMPVSKTEEMTNLFGEFLYEPIANTFSKKAQIISALDGLANSLSISNRWIYKFAGNNYSNWEYVGNYFEVAPGEGFTMKGVNGTNLNTIEGVAINPGNAQQYDFRGRPNSGNIKLPIAKEQTKLVGNPYPSALDMNKFLTENTATTGIAYYWDSSDKVQSHYLNDYEGGYGAYSPGAGVYLPAIFLTLSNNVFVETGEIGKSYGRQYAPIAQGFMVIGKSSGEINFKNSHRNYQKEKIGLSEFKNQIDSPIPFLKFHVTFNNYITRPLLLAFRDDATVNIDHAMDAEAFTVGATDAGWDIVKKLMVINVRPFLIEEKIPLLIKLEKESKVLFEVIESSNFNSENLFLYDAKDNLYYSIKTEPIQLSLPAGIYKNRFYISFRDGEFESENPTTPYPVSQTPDEPEQPLLNPIDAYQNNLKQQLEVKMTYDTEPTQIQVFDLSGKLVLSKTFKEKTKDFSISTQNLSTAIYIVKVKTANTNELTKKITIRN